MGRVSHCHTSSSRKHFSLVSYQTGLWCSYWNHGQASPLYTLHPWDCQVRQVMYKETSWRTGVIPPLWDGIQDAHLLPASLMWVPLATIQVFSIFATAVGEGLHTAPGACISTNVSSRNLESLKASTCSELKWTCSRKKPSPLIEHPTVCLFSGFAQRRGQLRGTPW